MSQLLKLTKKSCLKFFRKLSPLKQTSLKKLEEEEVSVDNSCIQVSCDGITNLNPHGHSDKTPNFTKDSVESLNSYKRETSTVQEFPTETDYQTHANNANSTNAEANTILQSLTSKLFLTADGYEFQRLQQLRSDTASEILQLEPEFDAREVVFEKVKYNKNVRYFRRTPSSSSLDNGSPNDLVMPDPSESSAKAHNALQAVADSGTSGTQPQLVLKRHHSSIAPHMYAPVRQPLNVTSLELRSEGKYQNVIIAEQRDRFDKLAPIVKWDINGNSLDEDFCVNDNWNELDGNWNYFHERRLAQFKLDDESQKSSFHSSSTTLETWLDEELLGNSFNEKPQRQFNLGLSNS